MLFSQAVILKMILILVCGPGYYKSGSSCELCTGNKIKMSKGDAADCVDACDGVSEVPNAVHTACGENLLFKHS